MTRTTEDVAIDVLYDTLPREFADIIIDNMNDVDPIDTLRPIDIVRICRKFQENRGDRNRI